jgi:hypothetical protein
MQFNSNDPTGVYGLPYIPVTDRIDLTKAPPGAAPTATEGLDTGEAVSHARR